MERRRSMSMRRTAIRNRRGISIPGPEKNSLFPDLPLFFLFFPSSSPLPPTTSCSSCFTLLLRTSSPVCLSPVFPALLSASRFWILSLALFHCSMPDPLLHGDHLLAESGGTTSDPPEMCVNQNPIPLVLQILMGSSIDRMMCSLFFGDLSQILSKDGFPRIDLPSERGHRIS